MAWIECLFYTINYYYLKSILIHNVDLANEFNVYIPIAWVATFEYAFFVEFSQNFGVYSTLKAFKIFGNDEGTYAYMLQSVMVPTIWGDDASNLITFN